MASFIESIYHNKPNVTDELTFKKHNFVVFFYTEMTHGK